MFVTSHVLLGAALGRVAGSAPGAAGLGLASHAALDAVPHWGTRRRETFLRAAVTDGLLGLGALAGLAVAGRGPARTRMLAGALAAAVPDLDKPCRELFGVEIFPARVNRLHSAIQRESPDRLGRELAVGAALAALVVALVAGGSGGVPGRDGRRRGPRRAGRAGGGCGCEADQSSDRPTEQT